MQSKEGDDVNISYLDYVEEAPSPLLSRLGSLEHGLSEKEAALRLKTEGYNLLTTKRKRTIIEEFLSEFSSPLIIILLFAALISLYVGEVTDAIIIFVTVILSVLLDFFEEHKADKSVERLIESVKTKTTVLRNGKKEEIERSHVCRGDILLLQAGDLISADARIVYAKDLFVNQSALTGESFPIQKTATAQKKAEVQGISDAQNIVFSGTAVLSGTATAVVFGTGKHTEFGKIAVTLSNAQPPSEFELGIREFGYTVLKLTLFLILFIFLFNSLVKHKVLEAFMFAVAIAVGITPELLPMIISVTMAKGSLNMAKKGTIVKKLNSIPNFGSMDILCTDKTGTLTENRIVLIKYTTLQGKESQEVLRYAYINSSFQTGIKNPMDEAVLAFKHLTIQGFEKIDEIPFDFTRKRMTVIVNHQRKDHLIMKGAVDEVFDCCATYHDGTKIKKFDAKAKKRALAYYHKLSSDGFRVLAIATRTSLRKKRVYSHEDETGLLLQGFIAFLDPPKKDVKDSLLMLEKLGVEIKILTGDNELVTQKICNEIQLPVKGVLLGKEVSRLNDHKLRSVVSHITIFARCSPEEKNRILLALRASGHVVGYLGDGINDAPSLKSADIGISVENAVDVAKESADLVLTRNSLAVLSDGIIEGRKAFGNTMKYLMMVLSSNFGNMFSAAIAILFLPFLPMLPIQILLNNFLYDFSQITLPADNVDSDWVKKPKRWNLHFIKRYMYVFGTLSSLFDILLFVLLFFVFKVTPGVFQTSWFIESLATQIFVVYVISTKNITFQQISPSARVFF